MNKSKGVLIFVLLIVSSVWLITVQLRRVSLRSTRVLQEPVHLVRSELARASLQMDNSHTKTGKLTALPPSHWSADTDENLADILKKKLSQFPDEKGALTKVTCEKTTSASGPCLNATCQARFSSSPEIRLKQILSRRNESLSLLRAAMAEVTREVSAPKKYLFVTAVSANHYNEMQALVKNLQTELFPRLSNYTFVMFDLGLTPLQRNMTEKNCRCTMLDYPFDKLPDFFSIVKCYTWKPTIIRSLIEKAEFLVWMDSSVRWNSQTPLDSIFQRCKERGLQLEFSKTGSIGVRTDHQTFRYYGDQPCQYEPYGEIHATYGVYHNEPFVRYAVLDPWLSCALNRQCMCLKNYRDKLGCRKAKFPRQTGVCHRFDQSSLGIILRKLYGDRINLVRIPKGISMLRGKTANWFTK